MNKKLVLPFITFLSILTINITSLISGVQQHQTWRIVVASIALLLMLATVAVILMNTYKKKRTTAR
ncbi:MAG: hypothetical protein ACXVJD_07380 [Mucilaginibacter sp.]